MLQDEQAISLGYGKTDYAASHGLQNPPATLHHVEYAGGKSKPMEPMEKDQVLWMNFNIQQMLLFST